MRLTSREVDEIAGVRPRRPERGEIWRAKNGWERHVLLSTAANITYIQVIHGRENITRNCLPVTWSRWALANEAEFVGNHK